MKSLNPTYGRRCRAGRRHVVRLSVPLAYPGSEPREHTVTSASSAQKQVWSTAMRIQQQLDDAVKLENFEQAAELRDNLEELLASLNPLARLELHHLQRLQTGTMAEKQQSLTILADISTAQDSVEIIASVLRDEHLVQAAEAALQQIWLRHPSNTQVNELMDQSILLMRQSHTYEQALGILDKVVALDPLYAEGWNKRATLKYLLHRFEDSITDAQQAASLQPCHYLALSGQGLCHVQLHDYSSAIRCFEAALHLNPHLSQIQRYCKALKHEHAAD